MIVKKEFLSMKKVLRVVGTCQINIDRSNSSSLPYGLPSGRTGVIDQLEALLSILEGQSKRNGYFFPKIVNLRLSSPYEAGECKI